MKRKKCLVFFVFSSLLFFLFLFFLVFLLSLVGSRFTVIIFSSFVACLVLVRFLPLSFTFCFTDLSVQISTCKINSLFLSFFISLCDVQSKHISTGITAINVDDSVRNDQWNQHFYLSHENFFSLCAHRHTKNVVTFIRLFCLVFLRIFDTHQTTGEKVNLNKTDTHTRTHVNTMWRFGPMCKHLFRFSFLFSAFSAICELSGSCVTARENPYGKYAFAALLFLLDHVCYFLWLSTHGRSHVHFAAFIARCIFVRL